MQHFYFLNGALVTYIRDIIKLNGIKFLTWRLSSIDQKLYRKSQLISRTNNKTKYGNRSIALDHLIHGQFNI